MSNDPFRIRDHVADFDDIVGDIARRSKVARETIPMVGDIAYGSDSTETVDLFFPEGERNGRPVHIFIHGGYWRMFSKRDYSYVAETITRAGAIAAIVDYALMPSVRMVTIVDQIRRAKQWVLGHIVQYGGDPHLLTVSGHSAGAHLATMLFNESSARPHIQAALLLGGLYELKPLQSSFLSSEIGITDAEAAEFSPITQRFDRKTEVSILIGAGETPPFLSQADAFARHLAAQGLNVSQTALEGSNHMSSVRDMGVSGTQAANLLESFILRYRVASREG
ncbi:alpha/beta hydrolase [Mesorhizobium sp. DCY119]|uniref:alpha/beta hydrolase n=1 Tax=Mesorhizobium sp. DCY119 TaxID=2108445 RepID=UPI000E732A19|nr:alpha/beta hydrolase [Mesorhizobium sp. DCY119]RJG41816.1 alpha/beta hydrolase [Mesorhizobium sp. DCY119]